MSVMRLDRFLSEMGAGTRKEIKENCRKKRIKVNGVLAVKPEQKVDPAVDVVEYEGQVVRFAAFEYYMLNKPAGVVTATEDRRQKTVLDLIEGRKRKDLFPVGRLDKDTEGLLLITNDGPLCNRLLAPGHHVDKTYFVRVRGCFTGEMIRQFEAGVDIGDEKLTLPAKAVILNRTAGTRLPEAGLSETAMQNAQSSDPVDAGNSTEILLTITEGRYHQVKRMCEAAGCPVIYLKRMSMGSLKLDESLQPGEYRELTSDELQALKE